MSHLTPSSPLGRRGHIGQGSPDEPPSTLPAEPSNVTPDPEQRTGKKGASPLDALQKRAGHEEPELALEPDLPTDGRDEVGEAMMRDLPQRPELSEPPSQPEPPEAEPDERAP